MPGAPFVASCSYLQEKTLGSLDVRGPFLTSNVSNASKDDQRAVPQYRASISRRRVPDVQILQLTSNWQNDMVLPIVHMQRMATVNFFVEQK